MATLAAVWAGLALWSSPSTSTTIALYQAGAPDTFQVQRLGAKPGPKFAHPELQGDGAIAGPVSVGRSIAVVRGGSVWILANPRSPARVLAPGCRAIPSDDADRIWVLSCSSPVTLQGFDPAGRALTEVLPLPPGYDNVLSVTSDGVALLVGSTLPHPAAIIWDSRTRRVVGGTDQRVTSVAPGLAVTQSAAGPGAGTSLLEIQSGQTLSISVPPSTTILAGVLSADARRIAVVIGAGAESRTAETELGVIDVRRRSLTVIPGSLTDDGYWALQWSRTGDRLVAGDGQPRPGLIARVSGYDLAHSKVGRWSVSGGPFTGLVIV